MKARHGIAQASQNWGDLASWRPGPVRLTCAEALGIETGPARCRGMARTTGRRCEKKAATGNKFCTQHLELMKQEGMVAHKGERRWRGHGVQG